MYLHLPEFGTSEAGYHSHYMCSYQDWFLGNLLNVEVPVKPQYNMHKYDELQRIYLSVLLIADKTKIRKTFNKKITFQPTKCISSAHYGSMVIYQVILDIMI